MGTIERLRLRQEIDELEEVLAKAARAREPDLVDIQRLAAEIATLEGRSLRAKFEPIRRRV